ncbi:MAG: hypothetical protein ABSE18_03570 [Minisyncoccia bacterium]|jgi:hypothetical protein
MPSTLNLREENENVVSEPRLKSRWNKRNTVVVIAIIALVIALGAWYATAHDTAWRAVFLTNNQVYFGHFQHWPFAATITLRDVYYLQIAQPSEQLNGEDQSQLKLVKLGNEIHGPTSEMVVPLSQIMFWETLRSDSVIVKTIEQSQTSQ